MLKPIAFAHAVTAVTAVFYVLCLLLVYTVPEFIFGIGASWFHGINLEAVRATTPVPLGSAVWGLVTMSAVTWVTTYAAIALYNKLQK